jgi:hypothetical protein
MRNGEKDGVGAEGGGRGQVGGGQVCEKYFL